MKAATAQATTKVARATPVKVRTVRRIGTAAWRARSTRTDRDGRAAARAISGGGGRSPMASSRVTALARPKRRSGTGRRRARWAWTSSSRHSDGAGLSSHSMTRGNAHEGQVAFAGEKISRAQR